MLLGIILIAIAVVRRGIKNYVWCVYYSVGLQGVTEMRRKKIPKIKPRTNNSETSRPNDFSRVKIKFRRTQRRIKNKTVTIMPLFSVSGGVVVALAGGWWVVDG